MLNIGMFLIELSVLFLLSRQLTNRLFSFFYHTTKSKRVSVYFMSALFLPGTLIHELSHAIMAILLQVRVGEMELLPKLVDNNLRLGSVQVAKSDPIRRFLIGAGPFLFGATIIIGSFFYAGKASAFSNPLFIVLGLYLVFEIGNTMFSSKKDMEGSVELFLTLIIIAAVLYIAGLRIPQINPFYLFGNYLLQQTLQKADLYLAAPIGIDLMLILLLKLSKY